MEHRLLAGLGVLQDDLAEQLIAAHVLHLFIAQNVDLGLGVQTLLQHGGHRQGRTLMDHSDLSGVACQIQGLLGGDAVAAHHVDLEVLEEVGVAHGAVADALAHILGLVLAADGAGHGTGADDNGLAQILALAAHELLHGAAEVAGGDGVTDTLAAELLALLGHGSHQLLTGHAVHLGLAGIVFDVMGHGDLAAVDALFQDQHTQAAAACVQTGSQTRRASTQDDYIINFVVHSNGSCQSVNTALLSPDTDPPPSVSRFRAPMTISRRRFISFSGGRLGSPVG